MRRIDLTPLLLFVPLLIALLPGGLPNTADMPVHFVRAAEMAHAWREGLLLPRWSANLGYGYGIPLFNYAPPLPYLCSAFLNALGLPLEWALKGTLTAALLGAAWGAYLLFRASFGVWPSAAGTVAFLYAPYRLRELFIQGNVGQFIAWSFIPWALWGLARLWETRRVRYAVVTALALAGALLSHNVVALMLGVILALQALGLWALSLRRRDALTGRDRVGRLLRLVLAGVGGVALAAWFSLPALLEGEFIQLDRIVASDYRARFVPLHELVALSPPLDRAAVNPYFPLTLGALQVALALAALIAMLVITIRAWRAPSLLAAPVRSSSRLSPPAGWGYLPLALIGAAMAHRVSLPLWERLPFVELFEFPARWHGFTAIGLGGLIAAGVALVEKRAPRWGRWLSGGAILVLLISSLVNLYPHRLPVGTLKASPADVVDFELETGAVGTTSLAEFNPRWRSVPLTGSPMIDDYRAARTPDRIDRASLPPGVAVAETISSTVERHRLRFVLEEPAAVTLNLLYFPGWNANVEGRTLPLTPVPETGMVRIEVPAGQTEIELSLRDTPLRRWSEWVSLVAWLVLVFLVARGVLRRLSVLRQGRGLSVTGARALVAPVFAVVILYFAFPGLFAPRSAPDSAYPARTPALVDFGQELRLLGVDLPGDMLRAGTTVEVIAYVRALYPLENDYAVYLHLDDSMGQTVLTSDQRHPAEIPTSSLPPSLYLRIPFSLELPADLPPMKYTWRLGWVDPAVGSPLMTRSAEPATALGAVWLRAPEPPRPAGPVVTFGEAVLLHGALLDRGEGRLTLVWERYGAVDGDVTVFVHLLDAGGNVIAQIDGDPFAHRYPLSDWRMGERFAETRDLPEGVEASGVAIGLYRRGGGERLPAFTKQTRLTNDALLIE